MVSVSQFMGRVKEYSAKEIVNWCLDNKEISLLTGFSTTAKEWAKLIQGELFIS